MTKHEILHPNYPDGIYRYEYPVLGGIPQYVQIRGENRSNPVLRSRCFACRRNSYCSCRMGKAFYSSKLGTTKLW